jgi:hypothetical protein
MMKSMSMEDPQRAKLAEATEIASAIATCEKDPMTKRMIIFSGLQRTMEGFPVSPSPSTFTSLLSLLIPVLFCSTYSRPV